MSLDDGVEIGGYGTVHLKPFIIETANFNTPLLEMPCGYVLGKDNSQTMGIYLERYPFIDGLDIDDKLLVAFRIAISKLYRQWHNVSIIEFMIVCNFREAVRQSFFEIEIATKTQIFNTDSVSITDLVLKNGIRGRIFDPKLKKCVRPIYSEGDSLVGEVLIGNTKHAIAFNHPNYPLHLYYSLDYLVDEFSDILKYQNSLFENALQIKLIHPSDSAET